MKRKLLVLSAMLGIMLFSIAAQADTLTFNLTVPNTQLFDGGTNPPPYASVRIDQTSTTAATITVTAFGSYLIGDGGSFSFNTAQGVTATASNFSWTGGWTGGGVQTGFQNATLPNGQTAFNISVFGDFSNSIDNNDGFTRAVSQLVFTLTADTGTWADAAHVFAANNLGWFAAAHIFPLNGTLTGFAAGFPQGTPNVPVPPTVWLLGSGLVGLGLMRWRKRKE